MRLYFPLFALLLLAPPTWGQELWASQELANHLERLGFKPNEKQRQKLAYFDAKSPQPNGQLELSELDLTGDGQISRKEIQFALSWPLDTLKTEGQAQLKSQPRLLPNRSIQGQLQLHLNNPEQIRDPGLLFDSQRLHPRQAQPVLNLGQGAQKTFEVYAYLNYQALRSAWAKQPNGQPREKVWYALRLTNPPGNPPLTLDLSGMGFVNDHPSPHAPQILTQLPPGLDTSARLLAASQILHATRSQDADLQYRTLINHPALNLAALPLAPGHSLLLTRPLPLKTSGDFRGQYRFAVREDLPQPLHFQAAVLTDLPLSDPLPQAENIWTNLPSQDFTAAMQSHFSQWIEPRSDGSTQYLKPSSDFSSPQALAAELSAFQYPALLAVSAEIQALWNYLKLPTQPRQNTAPTELPPADPAAQTPLDPTSLPTNNSPAFETPADSDPVAALPPFLRQGEQPLAALAALKNQDDGKPALRALGVWISPEEIQGYLSRLRALIDRLEQAAQFDTALLDHLRAWNAEVKMLPRVLVQAEEIATVPLAPQLKAVLKTFEHRFWGCLVALGRVNSVVVGQEVFSHLPTGETVLQAQDQAKEWNFVLNSNPLNTGGVLSPAPAALLSDAQIDALPLSFQSANVPKPPALNYGQYGVRYRIQGQFANESPHPAQLNLSFGSTDEMGHLNWRSLFDATDSLMGDGSTRFTGSLTLKLHSEGKTQENLISVVHPRLQAPQALLARPLRLKPGENAEVSLELVIPTNSTGPQFLQFRMEKQP